MLCFKATSVLLVLFLLSWQMGAGPYQALTHMLLYLGSITYQQNLFEEKIQFVCECLDVELGVTQNRLLSDLVPRMPSDYPGVQKMVEEVSPWADLLSGAAACQPVTLTLSTSHLVSALQKMTAFLWLQDFPFLRFLICWFPVATISIHTGSHLYERGWDVCSSAHTFSRCLLQS